MKQNFDAIVIGAGYIGCSVAYNLCQAGLKTALFDRGGMAAGASAANYGNIQVQDMELEASVELTKRGRDCFATLEDELDWKIGLRRIGGLLPIENETQWDIMSQRRDQLRQAGILSELVTPEHLPEIEPYLNTAGLLGALYHPDEGQVDPFQLMRGFLWRAEQKGLRKFYHTEVTGLDIADNRIRGVKTPGGNFGARQVILCTGAFTRHFGQTIGRDWPVHYVLGQAMVTEPLEFVLRNHIASASFFEISEQVKPGTIFANMAISQSTHGNILVGEAMYEAAHFKTHVPSESLPVVANCWLRYFPAFEKLRILRGWSAPVADTPDGLPLLGPVDGLDGLFVATAFRSTVVITPLVGRIMAQLLTTGQTDLDITNFLPERTKEQNADF
jgi:sarcosine oxidase subunit beta